MLPTHNRLLRLSTTQKRRLISSASVLAFLLLWELLAASGLVNRIMLSSPSAIARAAVRILEQGEIWHDLLISGTEFVIGFVLVLVVGIPFGLLLGWYRTFNYIFEPYVNALNAVPRVALLPLILIWLGLGIWSKVAIVFLGGVIPLILSAQTATRMIDPTLLRAARSFGATDWQIVRTIVLPSSVPYLLTGVRMAIGRALIGIVVGELVGGSAGLGFQLAVAGANFQTDRLFVYIFIITGFGMAMTGLLNRLERRVEAWRMHGE